MTWKTSVLVLVGVVLLGAGLVLTNRAPVQAAEQGTTVAGGPGMTGPAHYTVVETQGTNLLVTDNKTNTLYYYTIDKDKEIGSDLKLRASVDLTQVGKPVITITKAK
jgi:hypothetical protein